MSRAASRKSKGWGSRGTTMVEPGGMVVSLKLQAEVDSGRELPFSSHGITYCYNTVILD